MLCSKLHYKKVSKLEHISYKIAHLRSGRGVPDLDVGVERPVGGREGNGSNGANGSRGGGAGRAGGRERGSSPGDDAVPVRRESDAPHNVRVPRESAYLPSIPASDLVRHKPC